MLLEVKELCKSFGSRQAVAGTSFSVQAGEVFGLLGPNGAGKSTTMSLICGVSKADSGEIIVDGQSIRTASREAKKRIGIVPQEPALYPTLSAQANLRFWGTLNGLTPEQLNPAVEESLAIVGLSDRARERVRSFSGGMKRRLNIAAGLIHKPKLLIMDEPTVGIDPQSRNHILETVKNLHQQGITVIYTSHYVEEVEYLCTRVAIMDEGRIIAQGTLPELLAQGTQAQELVLTASGMSNGIQQAISKLPGVDQVVSQNGHLRISTLQAEKVLALASAAIANHGATVAEIKVNKPNLESLFLKLTGKALRD